MNTKERMIDFMCKKNTSEKSYDKVPNFSDVVLSQVPLKDVLEFHNELIDDKFSEIMLNDDLRRCVEYFFACDLNIAETSRKSYLHRNTLLYRIDKIQSATGFDIKHFDDAVAFKLLMMVYKMTK